MKLNVVYTTQMKAALGISSEEVELAAPRTAAELVAALAQRHGPEFRRLALGAADRPLTSLIVCVGDEQVPLDAPLKLKDGDVVTLLSAISGG